MTRRIAAAFAALVTILLVLATVPLGLARAASDTASFRYDTQSAARLVAAAAEEYLSDHHSDASMRTALVQAAARGDCAAVYRGSGALVEATPCRARPELLSAAAAAPVLAGGSGAYSSDGDWMRVSVPVGDDDDISGAVVFARSADPLDDRITAMWGWLALIAAGGLALGVLVSFRLARWVARPLSALDRTATRLGGGMLDARAPAHEGPAEVRRLAETFNRMAERTQTLVYAHRAWVADVSHQLRTPLTALRLRLDVLAVDADPQTATELAGAQDEIARLTRLVDGLLAVARAEAAVPRPLEVRADAVVAERVAAWEPVAREREIRLNARGGGADGPAPATTAAAVAYLGPGDLEQMLDNIIANALEAVGDGGTVEVAVGAQHGRVKVAVIDDGPGMSEQAKQAAFHRFANPGPRGNGLGLAIVQRLAAANGGTVALRDTSGGGLTVEIELPVARGRAEQG